MLATTPNGKGRMLGFIFHVQLFLSPAEATPDRRT